MGKLGFALLLAAAGLLGQQFDPNPPGGIIGGPIQIFPPELQRYLELTTQQVERMSRLNRDFNLFVVQKYRRSAQVQREIREWTDAEQVVPIELGLRYTELETIRREIREEDKKTQTAVRAVLTDPQRVKLRALEEAARLQPLIGQAVGQRLIDNPYPGNIQPVTGIVGVVPPVFIP